MYKIKGMTLLMVFSAVFISGCENDQSSGAAAPVLRAPTAYDLDANHSAWLRNHLPNETVAYINIPTPWNYLFDAKADALHVVQQLPAHKAQVEKIKQSAKANYFQYIPAQYQGIADLFIAHIQTSLEVAVINHSPTALLPTVAMGTRLKDMSSAELVTQLNQLLNTIDPSVSLESTDNDMVWTFKVGQFPVYLQYDDANGQLLIYGGMGASQQRMTDLWTQKTGGQLTKVQHLSQQADASGLNLKMWVAVAKLYQIGGAFVPPVQQQLIADLGLDQIDYIWMGAESSQGQSALALHVMMPEIGWRLMLPRATDWFDVTMAGQPRSVIQMTLPTSAQLKQVVEQLDFQELMTDKDRKDLQTWRDIRAELGFDFYDMLDAYQQQVIWVSDQSGSWFAMKVRDNKLRAEIDQRVEDYFNIKSSSDTLDGVEIMQVHFSIYEKLFAAQKSLPADAEKIQQFMKIFKDHVYWYEEDGVVYMSRLPQVLAMKKQHPNQLSMAAWLKQNQGGDWASAVLAYGKDIKHMPQDLYHYYLMLLQGLGDLAQTEVDLFALPTATQLNLPDAGRINLLLSSDAEKVSFKFGYEYSVLEPFLTSEGGFTTLAVVGILAAYAIPAYKDYTIRAKIAQQLSFSAAVKVAVSERIMANEQFNEETFTGIQDEVSIAGLNYYIDEETGMIVINMAAVDPVFDDEDELYLEPLINEGYIEWICYSSFKESYLPTSCKY